MEAVKKSPVNGLRQAAPPAPPLHTGLVLGAQAAPPAIRVF